MSDIFISYKKEEKEVAAKLAHALEKDGWKVWWDVEIPTGAKFSELIKKTLGTCDVTIVLWSKESVQSDWVCAEAEYARKYKKVFPVLIEDVPHQDLPLLFQELHTHDLTNWSGERDTPGYKDLYKDLVNLLGEPKSPEVRALEERLDKAQHELEQQKQDTQKERQQLEEQIQQRSSEADKYKDELNEAQNELEQQKQDLQRRTPSTFGKILPWVVTASIVVLGGLYLTVRAPSSDTQELQAEVSKWQAQAEDATKRVSELDTVNKELTATLNATEGNVNQLEDTVAKWQKRAEEAEGQIRQNHLTMDELTKKVSHLDAVEQANRELKAEVATLQDSVRKGEKQSENDRTTINELTERVSQLEPIENANEELESAVAKWQARAEQAEGQNQKDRQTIEALTKEVEQIHEQAKREAEVGSDMIGIPAVKSDQFSRFEWKDIQKALNDIGFDAGESDGIPGFKTRSAIKLFQESRGFPIGELTLGQRERLFSDAREADLGRLGEAPAPDTDSAILPEMVRVGDFYIGKYEVTQGEWKAIMGNNPSEFQKGDEYPVERVSFNDVQDFIRRLNVKTGKRYRLPTEEEWYVACHGGGAEQEYCGGEDIDELAWYAGNSNKSTHPVGRKRPNRLGIHDMSGNVWEWTNSRESDQRVVRGGSWFTDPRYVRSAYRFGDDPVNRVDDLGFRLAQDL